MLNRHLLFVAAAGTMILAAAFSVPAAAQDQTATPTEVPAVPASTSQATQASPVVAVQTGTSAIYVVQRGDDLFRIALKFGLTTDAVARANGILNPNVIYVGQKLILPGISPDNPLLVATSSPAVPASTAQAVPSVPPTTATLLPYVGNAGTPPTYTVQRGDTLYSIAVKNNTTFVILALLNHLPNPNLIYVGEVLQLPVSGTAPGEVGGATGGTAPEAPIATPAATESGSVVAETTATPAPTDTPVAPTAAPTAASGLGLQSNGTVQTVSFAYGVVVNPGSNPPGVAAQVTDLGAAWVKQIVSWKTIETTQGSPDFTALDAAVNAYVSADLHVLLTLTDAPDWARSSTAENGPPSDLKTFATFAGQVAARYKGKVSAYEIWNEPNLRRNWNGSPLSAASYVEMLRLAYGAIKSADNTAVVVSAGLAPTGFYDGVNAISDRIFLKQAYLSGLATYSDAIGVHPQGWANPPDATCCQASPGVTGWYNDRTFYFRDTMADYRQIMKDNNDGKKLLWITAFGWGSNDGVAAADSVNDAAYGFVKLTSAAEQAQYLVRAYEIAAAFGNVGPAFADNLNGCSSAGDPTSDQFYPCYFSLLDTNNQPRPVYQALQAVLKH